MTQHNWLICDPQHKQNSTSSIVMICFAFVIVILSDVLLSIGLLSVIVPRQSENFGFLIEIFEVLQ